MLIEKIPTAFLAITLVVIAVYLASSAWVRLNRNQLYSFEFALGRCHGIFFAAILLATGLVLSMDGGIDRDFLILANEVFWPITIVTNIAVWFLVRKYDEPVQSQPRSANDANKPDTEGLTVEGLRCINVATDVANDAWRF